MVEIKSRKERDNSFTVLRGMWNHYTRKDRYYGSDDIKETKMPAVVKEYLKFYADGVTISEGSIAYAKKALQSKDVFTEKFIPAIGTYDGEYVVPFIGLGAIECAAFKITHNQEEQLIMEHFLGVCESDKKAMLGLQYICYQLILDKQRIRLLKDLDIVGVLYSTYPDPDIVINRGFISYRYGCPANSFVSAAINGALLRGVSEEEIERVLPDNPEARFLSGMGWYQIAQIDSLMPGIAERV